MKHSSQPHQADKSDTESVASSTPSMFDGEAGSDTQSVASSAPAQAGFGPHLEYHDEDEWIPPAQPAGLEGADIMNWLHNNQGPPAVPANTVPATFDPFTASLGDWSPAASVTSDERAMLDDLFQQDQGSGNHGSDASPDYTGLLSTAPPSPVLGAYYADTTHFTRPSGTAHLVTTAGRAMMYQLHHGSPEWVYGSHFRPGSPDYTGVISSAPGSPRFHTSYSGAPVGMSWEYGGSRPGSHAPSSELGGSYF